jgi:hypothetical protein
LASPKLRFLLSGQKKVTKEEALNTSHLAVAAACRRRADAVRRTPDVCPDHSFRRNTYPLGRMTLALGKRASRSEAWLLLVLALRAPWVASRSAGLWGGRDSAFNI